MQIYPVCPFFYEYFSKKNKEKNIVFLGIGIEYELYGAFVLQCLRSF